MAYNKIQTKIELLRNIMIEVGLKEGLSSAETIRISKELDKLIISYRVAIVA
jgi:hypothetical protein